MNFLQRIDRVVAAICAIAVAAVVIVLVAGPSMIGAEKDGQTAQAPAKTETATTTTAPAPADGKEIFEDNDCGNCHTLAATGSSGAVGPNLDDTSLDVGAIAETIKSGRGAMPSFEDDLSPEEIAAVAEFVAGSGP